MTTTIYTASWTNGIGLQITATYEFDPEELEFCFRTHGEPSIRLFDVPTIIGQESFRWDAPTIL